MSDSGVVILANGLIPQLNNLWQAIPFEFGSPPGDSRGSDQNDSQADTTEIGRYASPTVVDQTQPRLARSAPGSGKLGVYQLLRELGKGGMGVVYLAKDPRLDRPVALKVVHDQRLLQPQCRMRFEREGAALARFSHPNIVQIYEVGHDEDQPFLALEYIAGGTLAEHLAGRPQPTRDSAQCVATLARAVQYAHDRGIIHRDLKPSNVLMQKRAEVRDGDAGQNVDTSTGAGRSRLNSDYFPKITDFGLAKNLNEQGMTESFDLLGTPGYMAPELATGGGASEAGEQSDVYSLGAILYEMFTGGPPFRGETILDTLDQVRSATPVAPRRLRPNLPHELEVICLKCLERSPARRYESAAALADDLECYLRGEPIHARPAAWWERFAKWVRRKPAAATLIGVSILFAILLVAGALTYNARLRTAAIEARRQQQRAETQYREARDTLRQMLTRASARGGEGIPKLQELLREQQEDALAFFLKVAEQHGDDPDVRFDGAQAAHQAGLLQRTLGRLEDATRNLRRAEEQFASLAAEFPNRPLYRLHHADTLKVLGSVSTLLPADAEDCLRRALARTVELVREQPGSIPFRVAEADTRITLGSLQYTQGNRTGSEVHFRRAVELYEALGREQPEVTSHRFVLAKAYVNLSVLMQTTERTPSEFHDKAAATLEQLHTEDPGDEEVISSLAVLRVNWAYVLAAEGQPDAAIAELTKNVVMLQEALVREPNHAVLRDRLYRSHGVRSGILDSQGRFAESAEDMHRTVELSPSPQQADYHRLFWSLALARAGQHQLAVTEIEDWNTRASSDTPFEQLLQCARVYGIAAEKVRTDASLSVQLRDETAARYATQAVDFLSRVKQSYGSDRWKREASALLADEQFRSLRDHAEFQRLLPEKQ